MTFFYHSKCFNKFFVGNVFDHSKNYFLFPPSILHLFRPTVGLLLDKIFSEHNCQKKYFSGHCCVKYASQILLNIFSLKLELKSWKHGKTQNIFLKNYQLIISYKKYLKKLKYVEVKKNISYIKNILTNKYNN